MKDNETQPLRADAARNAASILRAAREVYAAEGPEAPLEAVARRARVGIRTLYRRFPTKAALTRAALEQSISDGIGPSLERALRDDDSLRALTRVIEAAISLAARDSHLLAAALSAGSLTPRVYSSFYASITELMLRAQRAGVVRSDLKPQDLFRILVMLVSTLVTMDPSTGKWKRYVAFVMDAMTAVHAPMLMPAAPPLRFTNDATQPAASALLKPARR